MHVQTFGRRLEHLLKPSEYGQEPRTVTDTVGAPVDVGDTVIGRARGEDSCVQRRARPNAIENVRDTLPTQPSLVQDWTEATPEEASLYGTAGGDETWWRLTQEGLFRIPDSRLWHSYHVRWRVDGRPFNGNYSREKLFPLRVGTKHRLQERKTVFQCGRLLS
jgi:hypothetical protein